MIFSRLRRAKILHCIREYLSDNFHFSGNYHSKPRTDTPFKLFHSPAFAPPAELKQASKMLGWEIPSPLEENPTHTYGFMVLWEIKICPNLLIAVYTLCSSYNSSYNFACNSGRSERFLHTKFHQNPLKNDRGLIHLPAKKWHAIL